VEDRYFEGDEWKDHTPPKQALPSEVDCLLAALNFTKARGWLAADSLIRDFAQEAREKLAATDSESTDSKSSPLNLLIRHDSALILQGRPYVQISIGVQASVGIHL